MVEHKLIDLSELRNSIGQSIIRIKASGGYHHKLHEMFLSKRNARLDIDSVLSLMETLEMKLRCVQKIHLTYFEHDYDNECLTTGILQQKKFIQRVFTYDTIVESTSLEVHDYHHYRELVIINFKNFITNAVSILENLARIVDTVLKKRVIFGGKDAPKTITFSALLSYWDNLVTLGYLTEDEFYEWLQANREFINVYFDILAQLRNRSVHGYKDVLSVCSKTNRYSVASFGGGGSQFYWYHKKAAPEELYLPVFTGEVIDVITNMSTSLLMIIDLKIKKNGAILPV